MASQRHKLWEQGSTAAGEIHAQGVVAPGIAMQVDPGQLGELVPGAPLFNTGQVREEPPDPASIVQVPIGEPGGPLSGSSLTGAIPAEFAPPEPPEPPDPNIDIPVLTSITPNTGPAGGSDITCTIIGTGFTNETILVWNGADDHAAYNNETTLTTVVKLSTASIASTCNVQVRNGDQYSNVILFEITEPAEEGRPTGPFTINTIDNADPGMLLVMADGEFVVGDQVMVEATGNTSVNGNWTVTAVDGLNVTIDNDFELTNIIEAKGRVTITGAA